MTADGMHLYFAYGSNLCRAQMTGRCPSAVVVGRALLPGHVLVFPRTSLRRQCGVAGIVADPRGMVWGAVYRLTPQDFAALDGWEDFCPDRDASANAYNKAEIVVLRNGRSDEPVQAWTYAAVPMPGRHWPNADYRETMVRGAREHGLPPDYIAALERIEIQ